MSAEAAVLIFFITVLLGIISLTIPEEIAHAWDRCFHSKFRLKQQKLADIEAQRLNDCLSCARKLNDSAYEARKAMIMEALRLSQEFDQHTDSQNSCKEYNDV